MQDQHESRVAVRQNNDPMRRELVFPMIDVIRGFAAISVVVYHVIELFDWSSFPDTGFLSWFRIGWMGVDIFFVISGFVISLSAMKLYHAESHLRNFYAIYIRHRLSRIVPLYILTCVVFVVYCEPYLIYDDRGPALFISHALFIQNLFPDQHGGLNGANWSLATEMQFYILIAFTIGWISQTRSIYILSVGIITAFLWRYIVFIYTDIHISDLNRFVYSTELPGMLDEFAFGILIAKFTITDAGSAFLSHSRIRFIIVPAVIIFLIPITWHLFWQNSRYWNSLLMVVFFRSLLGLCCASVVLMACCLNNRLIVQATLPLRYLGKISYGIYLWHLTIILSFKQMPWLTGPRALPAVLVTTVLFAAGSWHFFEKPLLVKYARKPPETAPNA